MHGKAFILLKLWPVLLLRFLALFEESVKSHGSCFGHMIFAGMTELNVVASMVEIIEWRRQDVGIFVKVRCIGR